MIDIEPSGFFAFRTPLLPAAVFASWREGLTAARASDDDLEAAVQRDRALLVDRLRSLVATPVVREALFVASPSLDDAVDAWLKDPASDRAHDVIEILTRYLSRMCMRCTPFGLFSGCSVGILGRETRLTLAPRAEYLRHTRLDTHYLSALCEELEKDPRVRSALRFRPTTGLARFAGQLRYAEARVDPRYGVVSMDTRLYVRSRARRTGARRPRWPRGSWPRTRR
jgi:hypothetical protein